MSRTAVTQKIAFSLMAGAAWLIVLPVFIIVGIILFQGIGAINGEFIFGMPREGMRAGGIFPAIVGTLLLTLGTALFALPLGIAAAIYLSEYAQRSWLVRLIELSIVNLAGVPSIVYGLFGLGLFVIFLDFGASLLAGSLTLAIMTLPVVITASREALTAVPRAFREVSLSLGASRWQTIRRVVLPNALPGILTGTILGLSRAAGETAPILFTVAAFYLPHLPRSFFDQAMVLPYHIYVLATQVPGVSFRLQYGTVLVLVFMVLAMNITAAIFRSRARRRKKW